MKKRLQRKLELTKETLRALSEHEAGAAQGGTGSRFCDPTTGNSTSEFTCDSCVNACSRYCP